MAEIVLGWQEQDYQFLQANQWEMSLLNISHNTWLTFLHFHKLHRCFSLTMLKQQTHCTYVWQHKDVKAQCVDDVTTRLSRM